MPGTRHSGGRNKKSRRAHQVLRTYRRDRHGPEAPASEPLPPGRPAAPTTLAGDALAEWIRMVARLEQTKTLSTVDDAALYQYCCLFAETEGIAASRRENKVLIETVVTTVKRLEEILAADRGDDELVDIKLNVNDAIEQIVQLQKLDAKYGQQLRQGHMALRQYLVEFGMTPAARARVQPVAPAGEEAPPSKLAQLQAQAATLRRPIRVK